MNKTIRAILDIVLYIIVFLLIQLLFTYLVSFVDQCSSTPWRPSNKRLSTGNLQLSGKLLVLVSVLAPCSPSVSASRVAGP
jgi:hypothetical protein